jgi:hypothetical protein
MNLQTRITQESVSLSVINMYLRAGLPAFVLEQEKWKHGAKKNAKRAQVKSDG